MPPFSPSHNCICERYHSFFVVENSFLLFCLVERCRFVGLGHCGGQLRDLSQSHHGFVHRVSGESGVGDQRRVHGGLGRVQRKDNNLHNITHFFGIIIYRIHSALSLHLSTTKTARFPFPLHFAVAEDATSVPAGQQGVGVPEVRTLEPAGVDPANPGARVCVCVLCVCMNLCLTQPKSIFSCVFFFFIRRFLPFLRNKSTA